MRKSATPKPIPIPRDLKPGDELWYSETDFATVCTADSGIPAVAYFKDDREDRVRGRICAMKKNGYYVNYWCNNGREIADGTAPVVRIIRKTSKPARVDRDAAFRKRAAEFITALADTYSEKDHYRNKPVRKTLRAIARRLSGEGEP